MTEDRQVSESGGTMTRLVGEPRRVAPDLALLETLRVDHRPALPAGAAAYLPEGCVVTWRSGVWVDVVRVVRDDERGLVAWQPSGSERLVPVPRDGRDLRDRTTAEMVTLAVAGDYDLTVRTWSGPGVLRVAPTGQPWSVWFFHSEDGGFEGHYVNLELPHRRPIDAVAETYTRDLTLDLWLDAEGELWLKDADELAAALDGGRYSVDQGAVITDLADLAWAELVAPRAWPLDEGWETWRPPAAYADPLRLPDDLR